MLCIVLDTNVLVAAAYSPSSDSRRIVEACLRHSLEMVVSAELEAEYRYILPRAVRTRSYLSRLDQLLDKAVRCEVFSSDRYVPDDRDDDKVVAVAVTASASAIVTNDEHLLKLDPVEGIRVVQPTRFVALFSLGS